MKTSQSFRSGFCLGVALLAGAGYVSAQMAATSTPAAPKPFQSVLLTTKEKKKMNFTLRVFGSVTGRVSNDTGQNGTSAAAPEGIGGVKLTLRSRDAGFENFVIEQYSDADGIYTFKDLRPGKYTVEIDPTNLPKTLRPVALNLSPPGGKAHFEAEQADATRDAQRSLTGIVFIDNDRDGRYKKGSDELVQEALVMAGGNVAVSDAAGRYTLRNLPAGRLALLVTEPQRSESTHVVLDIDPAPVTNRVVNVPITRQL